jgi:Tol biopolymer transport system component
MQVALSKPVVLTHTPADAMDPVVTPDGKRIVFADGSDEYPNLTRDLYVVDIDGQNQTQLTSRPQLDWQAAVSPDGQRIAYVVEQDGKSDIYLMNADGSNDHNVTNTNTGFWEPTWSPDGKQLVVTSRTQYGNLELTGIDPASGAQTPITNTGVNNRLAHFTPDGGRIVFVSDRSQGVEQIYSMKPDGSDVHPHTPGLMFTDGMSLAPDGRVAFSGLTPAGSIDIYVVNANDHSPPKRIERSGMALSPQFSPDGSHLVYLANDAQMNMQIYQCKADGTDKQALTEGKAFNIYPRYTPDGKSLVFVNDASGKAEVCTLPL